jgi:hypothetical protein
METLTGTGLTDWRLGTPGHAGRYGSGYGVDAGSWAKGVTNEPLAYYGDTALLVDSGVGSIEGGRVRLCVHAFILTPPAFL